MEYSVRYHPQAEAALNSLDQEERSRVLASIGRLGVSGLSDSRVAKLNGAANPVATYVLRADNDLRVVFTATHNIISVLDVLNHRFAQRYG